MKLYMIRHLQTEWNQRGILQGRHDLSILPLGTEEAFKIDQNKERLKSALEDKVDVVCASSLQRTQQTAGHYGFTSVAVEPLLDELDFGEYEARPRDELLAAVGNAWVEDPRDIILGESISNLAVRIQSFLEKYEHCNAVLIFGHGCWMRALISLVKFGSLKQMNKLIIENNQLIELADVRSCG